MSKRQHHGSAYVDMVRAREQSTADARATIDAIAKHRSIADLSHRPIDAPSKRDTAPLTLPDTFRGNVHSTLHSKAEMNPKVNRAPHNVTHHVPDVPQTSGNLLPTASTQYYTADDTVKSPASKPDKWLLIIGNTYRAENGTIARLTRYDADARKYGYVYLGGIDGNVLHTCTARQFRRVFTPECPVTSRTYSRS